MTYFEFLGIKPVSVGYQTLHIYDNDGTMLGAISCDEIGPSRPLKKDDPFERIFSVELCLRGEVIAQLFTGDKTAVINWRTIS